MGRAFLDAGVGHFMQGGRELRAVNGTSALRSGSSVIIPAHNEAHDPSDRRQGAERSAPGWRRRS
jgi:hypothetical protein